MDAVTFLEPHIDMHKVLEVYDFDRIKERSGMIRSCCKLHGGNNPTGFVVNTNNNLWFCHTGGCGGGDVYDLVRKLEGFTFPQAVKKVAELMGVDIENLEILEHKSTYLLEMKRWLKTMLSMTKQSTNQEYVINAKLRDVAKYRTFQKETLDHFGLKYAEQIKLTNRNNEPYTVYNRLLVPIRDNGTQIGVSLRKVKADDKMPKWLHAPTSIDTSDILYNFDDARLCSTIVVTEGMFDVWAYHEIGITAVATFGAHLTEQQYRLLLKTGADLVWSYDGDEAGIKATESALSAFRYKANSYVVPFGETEDPASITREELEKRYGERKRRL
jgi:DNA primase